MRPDSLQVAVIEDDPIMGESLMQRLSLEGFEAAWWRTKAEAVSALRRRSPDAVLCDIRLPDGTGEEIFRELADDPRAPKFLFMTAFGDVDTAVRLMRAGACDYVTKPFDIEQLFERLERLLKPAESLGPALLGRSPRIRQVETLLRRVAPIDSTVLITGPSGSGKEVAARLLHREGSRAGAPFVAVNCAAIPGDLLESQIFGHEKGAFTGALARHSGLAEQAGEGVLFLDEVADLPLQLQPKLLRLLQERKFRRIGGALELPFRGRIVAATNADLRERVGSGAFREDLFYRLSVITVDLPALRDRLEDVVPLAEGFMREFAGSFGRGVRGFAPSAVELLLAHDWPGNVRELRNRTERAVALAQGNLIMTYDLFPERAQGPEAHAGLPSLAEAREDAERRAILRALEAAKGHVPAAAERLGVSRSTLFEKIKRFEIRVPHHY